MSIFVLLVTASVFGGLVLLASPDPLSPWSWAAIPVTLAVYVIQYGLMQHMNSKIRKEVNNGHQG